MQNTEPAEEILVVDPLHAAIALREQFGALVDDEYLPGKTLLRDALCERFGISQLESEEMCDDLERAGLLRFVRAPEGVGWHIHPDPDSALIGRIP
jgi:hypothetical protein